VRYKEATSYVLDVSDDEPFFYIDEIDILEAIQWIALSRDEFNNYKRIKNEY
jgi:hypothetical protein